MPNADHDRMSAPSEPTILIDHTGPLEGRVRVPGAKNSVLKLMAAALLTDGTSEITNVPRIVDVQIMGELLTSIGLEVLEHDGAVTIRQTGTLLTEVPEAPARRIRASINLLGPLVGRCGHIRVALPGGDDFGTRPIDLHLAALESMGATCVMTEGILEVHAEALHGADIQFAFPSVGATENVVTAAVVADGTTTIRGAAREPEVVDLCNFLLSMGAQISGIGTATLVVEGCSYTSFGDVTHRVVPDRIQAATYIAAVGSTGGCVDMIDARANDMGMFLRRCEEMGLVFEAFDDEATGLRVEARQRLNAVDIQTLPYPGVATDYKPLIVAMLAVANGTSIVTENLYPGRFRYVEELVTLGAQIRMWEHHAEVTGVPRLSGGSVRAHDIRAGAAMVVAGLASQGPTVISGVGHIDRGYDDLVGRLRSIGAMINRVD